MIDHWLVDGLSTAALAIALAASAGLRAWLPLFLAGALSRAGVLELGDSFRILGSNKALALFALATMIELLGDKIPVVDHALDLLSTFLRPAAGAVLAASVFGRVLDPVQSMAVGIAVGAPSALVPHAGKAALRALSTSFTAGLANPVLSLLEDGATVVLFTLAVLAPLLVAGVLIGAGVVLARRLQPRRMTMAASR